MAPFEAPQHRWCANILAYITWQCKQNFLGAMSKLDDSLAHIQFSNPPTFQTQTQSYIHKIFSKAQKLISRKKILVLTHKEARPKPIFEEEKMYQRRFSFDKPRFKQLYISSFFSLKIPMIS